MHTVSAQLAESEARAVTDLHGRVKKEEQSY